MKTFCALLLAAGGAVAQSYSVAPLPAPSPFLFFNLDGSMNNKGQVLGEAGNSGATVRFPVLWTNGIPQILPIPPGYVYVAVLNTYKVNDMGMVIGTVQEASSQRTHIVVWQAANPTVLADAPIAGACSGTGCTCSTTGSSVSYGLNSAGHILGSTSYPSLQPGGPGCSGFWVFDGASYRILPFPNPPQCPVGTTGLSDGLYSINDADQVTENVTNFFCGTNFPAIQPAVIQPGGSYSFLPLGPLSAAHATSINNRGNALGFYSAPTHEVVWDGNGVHDLGPSGFGALNNVGQVAYISNPQEFAYQIQIWQNGVSTPIPPPPGLPLDPHNVPSVGAINDAGQIAVQIPGLGGFLLSPSGACGQDVSSQVQVTRGGFRLNRTNRHFTQVITVQNTGTSTIAGPISIAFDGIPAAASLFDISGATLCQTPQGSPYINSPDASLPPGGSTSLTLDFLDTANAGITYSTRVLAGPGGR